MTGSRHAPPTARILLLTRYDRRGASSRLRCLQYLPGLADAGFDVTVRSLYSDAYLEHYYATGRKSAPRALVALVKRLAAAPRARWFDLLWIDDEILPWIPHWLERLVAGTGRPILIDLDDAVFHRYDRHPSRAVRALLGTKIDRAMRCASAVVAGNTALAERAHAAGARRVEIIPTVVDLERYRAPPHRTSTSLTIGWIGTPDTARYLVERTPALAAFCRRTGSRVLTVGAGNLRLDGVETINEPWSEDTEADAVGRFDVGIMPLPQGPWESGKSGYKLIQCMATGRPVVASPVGANLDIVVHGSCGFLADGDDQWVAALEALSDVEARVRMGAAARARVEAHYSLQVTAPHLIDLIGHLVRPDEFSVQAFVPVGEECATRGGFRLEKPVDEFPRNRHDATGDATHPAVHQHGAALPTPTDGELDATTLSDVRNTRLRIPLERLLVTTPHHHPPAYNRSTSVGRPMHNDPSHLEILRELLAGQLLGVLGTHQEGEPYTSLVGFAATPDLSRLFFATGRATRKHANLVADARASMLVDNRTNRPDDFTEAAAATAVGRVEEIGPDQRPLFDEIFLAKHPHLEAFVRSPSCAPMSLRVSVYMVVTRFQHVIELHFD